MNKLKVKCPNCNFVSALSGSSMEKLVDKIDDLEYKVKKVIDLIRCVEEMRERYSQDYKSNILETIMEILTVEKNDVEYK